MYLLGIVSEVICMHCGKYVHRRNKGQFGYLEILEERKLKVTSKK